ncbi:hypothetical protein KBY58_03320 [Cyanobium sp. HWJ4-Hawea]|uniref:hypothetical protein n=1 Tax=Cyanobium sp. HWJ4-Hawea TaxID=2823713 RepID=UPI0020CD5C1F|nr:hypothetical protein [Cyanobium sp. HWJ4-Hawea]MCP9808463.1 hypothetical protein [Cyanobium sp. HWJ4-Hawea]
MSTSWEPLPSIYRSKQEFLASLPPWRRLLQKLNWHPTIELKVQRYELQQRMLQDENNILRVESEIEQLKKENVRLAELNSKLDAIVFSSATNSTLPPSTPSESEM